MIIVNINEICQSDGSVDIEGKIINMNEFMLVVKDKTGQIFVRYPRKYRPTDEWQLLLDKLKIGNAIKLTGCAVVNYHGILQLKLTRKGKVFDLKTKNK